MAYKSAFSKRSNFSAASDKCLANMSIELQKKPLNTLATSRDDWRARLEKEARDSAVAIPRYFEAIGSFKKHLGNAIGEVYPSMKGANLNALIAKYSADNSLPTNEISSGLIDHMLTNGERWGSKFVQSAQSAAIARSKFPAGKVEDIEKGLIAKRAENAFLINLGKMAALKT